MANGSGSTRDMWLHTCSMKRRVKAGVDPATQLTLWQTQIVLRNEPCDLSMIDTTISVRTAAGTAVQTVQKPTLRIFPDDVDNVPDNNDVVNVSGRDYRVVTQHNDYDGASLRYLGSVVQLEAMIPDLQAGPTDDPNPF